MAYRLRGIPDEEKFRKILTDRGFKVTPQRLAVHRAMCTLVHAGADEVFEHISKEGETGISSMSVYNILDQLADSGIYSRRLGQLGRMTFDVDPRPHVHLYDKVSGEYKNIDDVEVFNLVEKQLKGRRWKGHKLESIDIQINCRPSRTKKKG